MAISSATHTFGGRPRSGQTPPRYQLWPKDGLHVVIDTQDGDKEVSIPMPWVQAELARIQFQKASL